MKKKTNKKKFFTRSLQFVCLLRVDFVTEHFRVGTREKKNSSLFY